MSDKETHFSRDQLEAFLRKFATQDIVKFEHKDGVAVIEQAMALEEKVERMRENLRKRTDESSDFQRQVEAAKKWRKCDTHPDVNGATMWGCPDCLYTLRLEKGRREELIEAVILYKRLRAKACPIETSDTDDITLMEAAWTVLESKLKIVREEKS